MTLSPTLGPCLVHAVSNASLNISLQTRPGFAVDLVPEMIRQMYLCLCLCLRHPGVEGMWRCAHIQIARSRSCKTAAYKFRPSLRVWLHCLFWPCLLPCTTIYHSRQVGIPMQKDDWQRWAICCRSKPGGQKNLKRWYLRYSASNQDGLSSYKPITHLQGLGGVPMPMTPAKDQRSFPPLPKKETYHKDHYAHKCYLIPKMWHHWGQRWAPVATRPLSSGTDTLHWASHHLANHHFTHRHYPLMVNM